MTKLNKHSATIEAKVNELLSKMTLEEKVAQMIQIPYAYMPKEEALEWARRGAGSFLHVLGNDAREVQRLALKTRLGIPVIFGIDAIHGHGLNENATIFPTQLSTACSFDPELVREIARATAEEVATDGLHWTFSPVLCLGRDTRWGRVDETFGEDPYLTGELGKAIIKGYQGESLDADDSILACAKHYIGYGEAVGARDACDTEMTFRKMRETFLPPFEKAIKAGCATFMTAYGSIDGTPFTASKKALTDILKDELGFDGFVVTDWANAEHLVDYQHVAADMKEATKLAAAAGNDMIMSSPKFYDAAIELVKEGSLDEKIIDEAVKRILRIKFRMGLFDKPEKKGRPGCIGCDEHLELAKKAARGTVTLLKNNGTLPLSKDKGTKIAVIGPNADNIRAQYGDWTYFTHPKPNLEHKPMKPYTTVLEGMKEIGGELGFDILYNRGCSLKTADNDNIEAAVKTAKQCDTIVLVVGDTLTLHGEEKDRADLSLSGKQDELFTKLYELGKPIVTVLVSSKPLCIENIAEKTDSLIVAFNGGMFGGLAVAEAIFGKLNPSGKLPISFPRVTGQVPVYYNHLHGWHGGKYVDLPDTPLFTFGEGISYTAFSYSEPKLDQRDLTLTLKVTNTGDRDGFETVQLYFDDCVSSVMTPVKQLIAFEKIFIKAKERVTVSFKIERSDLSLVTPDERRITEPGDFILMVGPSSKDSDLKKVKITLK